MPEGNLLTPPEAAARLRISRATLYELIARGEIRGLHVGRKRLFTVQEIDKYVASREAAEGTALPGAY